MNERIVLTSLGSFGDLHPFISVAQALKERGFIPVMAASESYRQKVTSEGLEFFPVTPTLEELLRDTGFTEGDIIRNLTTKFVIDKSITPYIERSYEDLRKAMQDASAVVACNFSMMARITADKLGLPVISLILSPCVFFSAEEPAHLFEAPWLRPFRDIFGAGATRFILDLRRLKSRWQTRKLSAFRRSLGLPRPSGDELLDGALRTSKIYGLYSPTLGHLPPDAPANSAIAGYTFYDSLEGGQQTLSAALEAFLAAGSAPLVFTLGSTGVHAPDDFYDHAADAARRLGMRAVMLVGSKAEARLARLSSADIFIAPYTPHSLIFPRAAANIHHGGIGTVGQALRAGRVQMVCPMFGDQADNAERLVKMGVAKRLDHRLFTADLAVEALSALLADKTAISCAAAYGTEVGLEDGAGVVADGIAEMLVKIAAPSSTEKAPAWPRVGERAATSSQAR